MKLLENISQLATCRDDGGQSDIHAIADGAVVWEGDTIRWAGPRRELPGGVCGRGTARRRGAAGDPRAGGLPHASGVRRMAGRGVRAADPGTELSRHRGRRRGHRADGAADARSHRRDAPAPGRRIPPRDARPRRHHGRVQERLRPRPRARAPPAAPLPNASPPGSPCASCRRSWARTWCRPSSATTGRATCPCFEDDLLPAIAQERPGRLLRRVRRALRVQRGRSPAAAPGRPRRRARRQAPCRSAHRRRWRRAGGRGRCGLGRPSGVRIGGGASPRWPGRGWWP